MRWKFSSASEPRPQVEGRLMVILGRGRGERLQLAPRNPYFDVPRGARIGGFAPRGAQTLIVDHGLPSQMQQRPKA